MKAIRTSITILGFFFLVACSSQVVGIYNPGSLKSKPQTFHVYTTKDDGKTSVEKQEFDAQLISIITATLESKSLKKSSLPDLFVSFIISVHSSEELTQSAYSPYDYRFRNYNYYDPMRFNSQTFKQGVLIIDIRNAENKLVWQGSKSFKLNARKSSTEELVTFCQEIIAEFDPALAN